MEYRKFKADYLFNGSELLNNSHVLITDSKGKITDIVIESEAGQDVEALNGILTPGFINAHCHLELSHLRNTIPQKTGLANFVVAVISERHYPVEEIVSGIEKAEDEMLRSGIVGVGDICNNTLSLVQKEKKNLRYYNFIEASGWNPQVAQARFENSHIYFDEFIEKKLAASIVPHAPYSVSEALWGKITPFFYEKVETIHNQETEQEDQFFLKGTGDLVRMYQIMKIDNLFYQPKKQRSVQSYFKYLSPASSVILVHNTYTKQEDVNYIHENRRAGQLLSFCICVNANLYIENKLPPLELLMQNNCNIVVGTDSLASNHQLSILEELKTIVKYFPDIPTESLLKWATINGAKALQMDDSLGNFEKGKTPGLVLIGKVEGEKITPASVASKIL